MGRVGRAPRWVAAGGFGLLTLLLLAPDRFGLTMSTPFAQVIAFRGALGCAFFVAGTVLLAAAALARGVRRRRARRRAGATAGSGDPGPGAGNGATDLQDSAAGSGRAAARRGRPSPAVALAVVLLLAGAGHLAVLASRGLVNAPPTTPPGAPAGGLTPGAVTVLAVNTLTGATPPEDVATVAAAFGADVLALPETTPEAARAIADLLAETGRPMQAFSNDRGYSTVFTTSLLVSTDLGVYAQVPTREGVGYVRVARVDAPGPTIIAVHPSAPVPSNMEWWSRELVYAVELCRDVPGAIVAGDFNATLDHAPMRDLGRCVDAAAAAGVRGAGAFGTWPTSVHPLLGAPIDHVLADDSAWSVEAVGVVQVGASDHRGIVARLVPTVGPEG